MTSDCWCSESQYCKNVLQLVPCCYNAVSVINAINCFICRHTNVVVNCVLWY